MSTDKGEVEWVACKRQVTLSLVDFASSGERVSKISLTEDHVKPASYDLARACTTGIATTDAAAEAKHVTSVRCT